MVIAASSECCLTPRSSGATTAGHQARAGGTRYIFTSPGLASCRCRPLSSNVRQRNSGMHAFQASALPHRTNVFGFESESSCCSSVLRRSTRVLLAAALKSARQTRRLACAVPPEGGNIGGGRRGGCSTIAAAQRASPRRALPNPSLKRSANGRPPGPVWRYAVHFRQPGPGVLPSSPA